MFLTNGRLLSIDSTLNRLVIVHIVLILGSKQIVEFDMIGMKCYMLELVKYHGLL